MVSKLLCLRDMANALRWTCTVFSALALPLLLPTCVRFSPFEIGLSSEEQDQTAKNLAKLARVHRGPASAAAPLTFAFLSDTHDGYAEWRQITSQINARSDIELTLHGGDLTDLGTQQEYRWAHDIFKEQRVPFFAAPGNHDGLASGVELYAKMFGPTNFDFSYAGIHFIVLNTNPIEWGIMKPDLDWLTRTATQPGYIATFVLTHQPPYSNPGLVDPVSTEFKELVVTLGVALYMYGHLHADFGAEPVGETTFVKVQTGLQGSWLVVHTDGKNHSFEVCQVDVCTPTTLPTKAEGIDPTSAP